MFWIPLIGPIFQGIASIVTPFFNEKGVAVKAAADVTIAESKASANIIATTNDDIWLRIIRDGLCVIPTVWASLVGWDSIVAHHYPKYMFHPVPYPPSLSYLPYAVFIFLLGNIGINTWARLK